MVAAADFDTFFAKGWAPTWNDMGHGNWATDRTYSGKVIGVYQQMVTLRADREPLTRTPSRRTRYGGGDTAGGL